MQGVVRTINPKGGVFIQSVDGANVYTHKCHVRNKNGHRNNCVAEGFEVEFEARENPNYPGQLLAKNVYVLNRPTSQVMATVEAWNGRFGHAILDDCVCSVLVRSDRIETDPYYVTLYMARMARIVCDLEIITNSKTGLPGLMGVNIELLRNEETPVPESQQ